MCDFIRRSSPLMDLGLEGRLCVVTGATRGIGAATARMLAQEGARVLSVARSGADLELDVTAPDAGERVLERLRRRRPGRSSTTRARASVRPLDELTDEDWQEQWELHVMAPMRLMRALAPAMAEAGGGRIVNVSSSSGKRPSLDSTPPTRSPRPPSCRSAACSPTPGRPRACSSTRWRRVRSGTELWTGRGRPGRPGRPPRTGKTPRRGARGDPRQAAARPDGHRGRDRGGDRRSSARERASNVTGAAWSVDGGAVPVIL